MKSFNPIAEFFRSLAISVALMFIGFAIGQRFIPVEVVLMANILLAVMLIALIGLALFTRIKKKKKETVKLKMKYVYLYTFIEGILLYPILQLYIAELGATLVTNVLLGITIFLFVAYLIAKKVPNEKIRKLGAPLFIALSILLILSLAGIFFISKLSIILISILGIGTFGLFTIYDLSMVFDEIEKGNIKERDDLSFYVLNIFLDIVNLLLDILRLIWILKD